ncbi:MAG: response regulator [Ferruginibacter sp.]
MGSLLKTKDLEVLIIDDEKDICYLLGSLFKGKKLDTAYVNTIKEAQNILKITHPDVIFLDNHLPDGLGINFIAQIKEMHPKTKVVMITAHDNPEDRDRAMQEGADYFISKPFSRESVSQTVESIILH